MVHWRTGRNKSTGSCEVAWSPGKRKFKVKKSMANPIRKGLEFGREPGMLLLGQSLAETWSSLAEFGWL